MDNQGMTREEFQALVLRLEEMPQRVRQLVQGLGEGERVWKPGASEFSATENVCHLRDIEEEGYGVRIRRLIEESEPFLHDLDGAGLARERDYNSQSMGEALKRFASARMSNVAALRSLPPGGLERKGTFEGSGSITLARLLVMMREHDEGHIKELETLRARFG
jgi:hypothetical protein